MKRHYKPLINNTGDQLLVRHWAKQYGVKEVWVCAIGDGSDFMFMYDVSDGRRRLSICRPLGLAIERSYTIKQLCGEEEE